MPANRVRPTSHCSPLADWSLYFVWERSRACLDWRVSLDWLLRRLSSVDWGWSGQIVQGGPPQGCLGRAPAGGRVASDVLKHPPDHGGSSYHTRAHNLLPILIPDSTKLLQSPCPTLSSNAKPKYMNVECISPQLWEWDSPSHAHIRLLLEIIDHISQSTFPYTFYRLCLFLFPQSSH